MIRWILDTYQENKSLIVNSNAMVKLVHNYFVTSSVIIFVYLTLLVAPTIYSREDNIKIDDDGRYAEIGLCLELDG